MNQDTIQGNWKQFKGTIREQWGKITDDDVDVIAGKRDQLLGKIQERYGMVKDDAEKEVKKFEESCKTRKMQV
ncbi:MAG: CsbD family protein, partial [Acidobacteriota bacterium]